MKRERRKIWYCIVLKPLKVILRQPKSFWQLKNSVEQIWNLSGNRNESGYIDIDPFAVYECHKKYSFSIRIVISEFLPKRSYFLSKTQTILHYPNMISSCISNFHKLSFVISNRWIFQRFNPVDFSIAF